MSKLHKIFQQRWSLIVLLMVVVGLTACGDNDDVPPTEVRVITNTPSASVVAVGNADTTDADATLSALVDQQAKLQATIDAQATSLASMNNTQSAPTTGAINTTIQPTTVNLTPTTPTATSLPSIFPTPRIEQVIVVEQVFEHGRMFWFRDRRLVWVVVGDEIDPTSGEWLCFEDTFVEGDQEFDPEFDPPTDYVTESSFANANPQQPIRGFGKVWRETPDLRENLGYALTSEIEHNSPRTYIAGGRVNADDEYVPGAGEYRVNSYYNMVYTFLEDELNSECPTGRWRSRPTN